MTRTGFGFTLALAGFVAFHAAPVSAQLNRTFVSNHGSDNGNCGPAAPCRSFQHAHDQTNDGGEVTVLDPAGYGSLAITKSISIVNDGVGEAGITTPTAVDGITINGGVVNLRGLTLVGGGVGVNGITVNAFNPSLNIQNCVIRGFSRGIDFTPTGAADNHAATLNVSDTIVSNNSGVGIRVLPSGGGQVRVFFERTQAIGNQTGFDIDGSSGTGNLAVTAANSLASENGTGFKVVSAQNQSATSLMLFGAVASQNTIGVESSGVNATALLAGSVISGNATGYSAAPGTMQSFGDNRIVDGLNQGSLTPTNKM